jgi:hypothetical protein
MQVPTPQASVQAGLVEHVRALLPLLKSLFYSRASLEKQMGQVFASHPEAAWWKSLPGLSGPLTAARLLAWIGDNRERFPSAQVLQARRRHGAGHAPQREAALCRGDTNVLAAYFPDLPLSTAGQPVKPRPVYPAPTVTVSHAPRSEAEELDEALDGIGLDSLDFAPPGKA